MTTNVTDSKAIKPSPTFEKRPSPSVISPMLLALFVFAILLTGIIVAIFTDKYGYQRGFKAYQNEINEKITSQNVTTMDIKSLNLKVELLDNELSTVKQERDISLNNLGLMRKNLQDLEVKNLQLQQVNDVFADTLAEQGGLPLQLIGAKIEPLPENAFEYRFDVAMLAEDGKAHRLKPTLTLLNESSLVNVPLDPKSYSIKGVSRIRGRFVMPEGFKPKQVKINLTADGQEVEQFYNWRLSSRVDHMPISLAEIPEVDDKPIAEE